MAYVIEIEGREEGREGGREGGQGRTCESDQAIFCL